MPLGYAKPVLQDLHIPVDNRTLEGRLIVPDEAGGLIIFSHGSGSSRFSPRNQMVAAFLHKKKFATLLFDLLTVEEDRSYNNRFDIDLLTERLIGVTKWIKEQSELRQYDIGYFGASTGAASALKAAARLPETAAVVSRGGRPDLAGKDLSRVVAPTLLVVGSLDYDVIKLNEQAYAALKCEKKLEIIEGASHLFEEPGTMDQVCERAESWFEKYVKREP
jgi:pimeloyl-ACP methyl ester carboxylesterase